MRGGSRPISPDPTADTQGLSSRWRPMRFLTRWPDMKTLWKRLGTETRGNVAIVFALVLLPLLLAVGATIDLHNGSPPMENCSINPIDAAWLIVLHEFDRGQFIGHDIGQPGLVQEHIDMRAQALPQPIA